MQLAGGLLILAEAAMVVAKAAEQVVEVGVREIANAIEEDLGINEESGLEGSAAMKDVAQERSSHTSSQGDWVRLINERAVQESATKLNSHVAENTNSTQNTVDRIIGGGPSSGNSSVVRDIVNGGPTALADRQNSNSSEGQQL